MLKNNENTLSVDEYFITGDSIAPTSEGFCFINSLISEDFSTEDISIDLKSVNNFSKTNKVSKGEQQKIKKVFLNNGMSFAGSDDLPVLCLEEKPKSKDIKPIWKKLRDLKTTDYILLDMGYNRSFGQNNKFKQAKSIAAGIALISNTDEKQKTKIINYIKEEKIDLSRYINLNYSQTLFVGTEKYLIRFFNALLRYTKVFYLKSDKGKQRGLYFVVDNSIAKQLQVILASSFGINSILFKKGMLIPNDYISLFASYFNYNSEIPILNSVRKLRYSKQSYTFSKVSSIANRVSNSLYNIDFLEKNAIFSANGVFFHS